MELKKIKLADLDFWYQKDDRIIGQRIALEKYEQYETAVLLSQINKNSVVVDVGVNIGYYTLLAAQKAKKVYAFEPDKDCYEILKKNVEENNLKNVVLFNKAVGSRNEKVGIVKNKDNMGDSRVVEGNEIECVRLDDVIKGKIDLIKIDVQGYEVEVVEGAKKIIERDRPIMFLEVENKNIKKIKSLKSKYKWIWSVNDFAETPWPIWPGIQIKNNNGYADLWIKNEMSIKDYWTMVRNVRYKKWLKGIIRQIWQK